MHRVGALFPTAEKSAEGVRRRPEACAGRARNGIARRGRKRRGRAKPPAAKTYRRLCRAESPQ
nr:MAG TPA: hypothetical protein [Caudoviricetes sp.]